LPASFLVESGQGPFDNAVKRRGFCRLVHGQERRDQYECRGEQQDAFEGAH
jgi:hypothetical protein